MRLNVAEEMAERVVFIDETSVGAPGFEPGTSCSRSKRATELRYAPNRVLLLSGEQLSGFALFHKIELSAN